METHVCTHVSWTSARTSFLRLIMHECDQKFWWPWLKLVLSCLVSMWRHVVWYSGTEHYKLTLEEAGSSGTAINQNTRRNLWAHSKVCVYVYIIFIYRSTWCVYRGADKSLARPGRKQARKHVRDARDFNNIETRAVINFFFQGKAPKEIHAILTETLAYFFSGRAKDLSATLYVCMYT